MKLKSKLLRLSMVAYLLRALGLEFINSLIRKWSAPEPPKPALRKSFWISLSRCSIHFLPMTVLLGLIYVNYRVSYLGPGLTSPYYDSIYLALFQVAAKVQEMMCVASLSTIVLQLLRSELFGDGVPVGLLGSGLWFSQISSFWSPEFLVAAPYMLKKAARCRLYILLIVSGVIAAVIGPASAVLMLPRIQNVPAGGTSYFLNGTAEQFWPGSINSSSELDVCSLTNATKYAVCPSGGYEALRQKFDSINFTTYVDYAGAAFAPLTQANGYTGGLWNTFLVQSPRSLVPPVISSAQIGFSDSVVVQPHAATVIVQQQLVREWNDAAFSYSKSVGSSLSEYRWARRIITSGSTTNPWVRTRCTQAQNLSADADKADFPYLEQWDGYTNWGLDMAASDISDLDRNESSNIRAQWASLAMEPLVSNTSDFGTVGLLLELPWSYGSRVAIGCSISAAWHNGEVSADSSANYDAWTNELSGQAGGAETGSPNSNQSNRPITLDQSWLDLLTPPSSAEVAENSSWVPNTLESIFLDVGYNDYVTDLRTKPQLLWIDGKCTAGIENSSLTDVELWDDSTCGKGNWRGYTELVIASVVADGLSRYGSSRVYNVQPDLQDWTLQVLPPAANFQEKILSSREAITMPSDPTFVVQSLAVEVVGYAYYASTTTDYLATLVACAYILLAGGHIVWVLSGLLWPEHWISSSSWQTISELLVLCQNSPPSVALKNTSTGIQHLATYTTVVKVRATHSTEKEEKPNLILLVEDGMHEAEDTDQKYPSSDLESTFSKPDCCGSHLKPAPACGSLSVSYDTLVGDAPAHGSLHRRRLIRIQTDEEYS